MPLQGSSSFQVGAEGRNTFSLNTGEMLTEIIGPVASGVVRVEEVVDPRLRSDGHGLVLEEVKVMASMARMCVGSSPMVRPCASEINVALIKDKFQSIIHL